MVPTDLPVVLEAIRSAIRDHLGAASDVRITAVDNLLPSDGRFIGATAGSFVAGYYTHALLEQRHGTARRPTFAALDHLVDDTRLVAGRG